MPRRLPPASVRETLLLNQNNRCFYCQLEFGSLVVYENKGYYLTINYDHLIPFSYLQKNPIDNFVAACQICNGIKHSLVFDSIRDAFLYVQAKRYNKKTVHILQEGIQNNKRREGVLQSKLQSKSLERKASKDETFLDELEKVTRNLSNIINSIDLSDDQIAELKHRIDRYKFS